MVVDVDVDVGVEVVVGVCVVAGDVVVVFFDFDLLFDLLFVSAVAAAAIARIVAFRGEFEIGFNLNPFRKEIICF